MKVMTDIVFGQYRKLNLRQSSHIVLIYDRALNKYKNAFLRKIKTEFGLKKSNFTVIGLDAKETSKSFAKVNQIYKILSKKPIDKKSILIGLGGGVIGDISGFIASTYLRGISYINVPTTILSQVDSSIGGKNGVNLDTGKNLVGTFYQPQTVIIDFSYLKSLSDREIVSGLGEILKYSLLDKGIKFPEFKAKAKKKYRTDFLDTIKNLTPLCISYKMKLVRKDEYDEKGVRQLLNLGHTFGHILETLTSFKVYKHGEAVIWGIKFACIVSYEKGLMSFADFREIMNLANKLPIPSLPRNLNPRVCYKLALKDKKSHNQNLNMVLLEKIGSVKAKQSVSEAEFIESVKLLKDFS